MTRHNDFMFCGRSSACTVVLLMLTLAACEDRRAVTAQRRQPSDATASARRDSLRERTRSRLVQRPDTLGLRADSGRIGGGSGAKVWMIVQSDFQCAPCRDLALNILPQIRKEFVDGGRLRIGFVNDPQDANFNARFAALAALCASTTGRFWQMHDALFEKQGEWDRLPDPRPYFNELAASVGVPAAAQAECISKNRMLRLLSEDIERSRASGAVEVPTVFVGDRRLERGELSVEGLRRAVRTALAAR